MRHARPVPRIRMMWTVLSLLTVLSACSPTDRFSAGEPVTPDELASVSEAVFGTVPAPTPDTYPAGTVFWIASGTAYHSRRYCRHMPLDPTAMSYGTAEDARAAGKTQLCLSCAAEDAADESTTEGDTP